MSSSDTSTCVGSYKIVTHSPDGIHQTLLMIDFGDLAAYREWASGSKAVAEVVEGFGDEAFVGPRGAADPTILCVRSGTRAVRISMAPAGREQGFQPLEQVAEIVLNRL